MQQLKQINREEFPALIGDIAEVVGDEAALALFIRFNGRHLTVPHRCPAGHLIEQTIGKEKAAQFCKFYKGENLDFPRGAVLLRKARNKAIIEEAKTGVPRADLATKYQLTERQIYKIISE